jgi:alpha-glucosidase
MRFTVLAPAVVRIEYHAEGAFDDAGTVNVLNRRTPVPAFTVKRSGDEELVLTTSSLELSYAAAPPGAAGEPGFLAAGLSVRLLVHPFTVWTPQTPAKGNLHGTIRTLDRVGEAVDLSCVVPRDAMTYYAHCEEGLVSRDGWVVMDDSLRPRLHVDTDAPGEAGPRRHPSQAWPWVAGVPEENLAALQAGRRISYYDWYFMGHGLDFPQVRGWLCPILGARARELV